MFAKHVPHAHAELPADHPHLAEHIANGQHAHTFVIDDLHTRWPARYAGMHPFPTKELPKPLRVPAKLTRTLTFWQGSIAITLLLQYSRALHIYR